ncbi:unnamed protein product [Scytosiphon promiscuus]
MRVLFKVNMKLCNVDVLEREALAVSDPGSPRYGQHLSSREACEVTMCPGYTAGVRAILQWVLGGPPKLSRTEEEQGEGAGFDWEEGEWLRPEGAEGDDDGSVMAKVTCSHVTVSMSAARAAEVFPEAAFRPHRRSDPSGVTGASAIMRATGEVSVPDDLAQHVEFMSGLTELWVPGVAAGGMGKLDGAGAGAGRPRPLAGMESGDFTEVMIQPRTLRTLYGVPDGERGGWAGQGNNRLGIAAFDDSYLHADLCAAHNLLAPDSDWLSPPDVTDHGWPGEEASMAESDLDTQYVTLMGPGVPVTFAAYQPGEWMLDWASEAAGGHLARDQGGPLVWSISYGFPEAWTCDVQDGLCDQYGYDPSVYLKNTNVELASLASQGVTVLVASGDDGAGLAPTCPLDPRLPVDVSGGAVEGAANECPFPDRDDCNCGSFELASVQTNSSTGISTTSRCILPLGLVAMGMGIDTPGAECETVLAAPDCATLLLDMENGNDTQAVAQPQQRASTCEMAFNISSLSFYSDCKCADVPKVQEGSCTLSGYEYHPATDGETPFTPSFPASSPWVTSVGATQVAWDLAGSCLQSDLLGPGNSQSAETAVNKFTGGLDSGGGFSTIFPAEEYQTAHTARYVATKAAPPAGTFKSANRGFPDISAAGHNFVVVVGGKVQQVGGTSASAPAVAGMVALLNERLLAAGKPPLGFLNPALYKAAEERPSTFQPVLPKTYNFSGTPLEETLGATYQVGSNKCSRYSCCGMGYGGSESGGWDPVTGLGTINYQELAEYLNVPPSPHSPEPRGGGRDRHHAAYVAWIVVLVFGLLSATLFLVYEHRPKLMLSAATLGQSVRNMSARGGGGGGGDGSDSYEAYGRSGGWSGGSSGGGGGRPHGALTEMVMGSEIGSVGGDAMYSLLEEHDDDGDDNGDDRKLEGQREEEDRGARRSV